MWVVLIGSLFVSPLSFQYLGVSIYFGVSLLGLTSIISIFFNRYTFYCMLFMLLAGTLNLVSYESIFNMTFYWGINKVVSPGIQIYSLILLIALIIRRRKQTFGFVRYLFGFTTK